MQLYILLVQLSTLWTVVNCLSKCDKINSCSCKSDKGVIDLKPLDKTDGTAAFTVQDLPYAYSYNPCTPVTVGTFGTGCNQIAVCQGYSAASLYYDGGVHSSAQFAVNNNGEVTISYNSLDGGRHSAVTLKCDKNTAGNMVYVSEQPLGTYNFEITSKHVCINDEVTTEAPYTTITDTPITTKLPTSTPPPSDNDGLILIILALIGLVALIVVAVAITVCTLRYINIHKPLGNPESGNTNDRMPAQSNGVTLANLSAVNLVPYERLKE